MGTQMLPWDRLATKPLGQAHPWLSSLGFALEQSFKSSHTVLGDHCECPRDLACNYFTQSLCFFHSPIQCVHGSGKPSGTVGLLSGQGTAQPPRSAQSEHPPHINHTICVWLSNDLQWTRANDKCCFNGLLPYDIYHKERHFLRNINKFYSAFCWTGLWNV